MVAGTAGLRRILPTSKGSKAMFNGGHTARVGPYVLRLYPADDQFLGVLLVLTDSIGRLEDGRMVIDGVDHRPRHLADQIGHSLVLLRAELYL